MKAIAKIDKKTILVQMTVNELSKLAGFRYESDLDRAFNCKTEYNVDISTLNCIETIPVSELYEEALDTLSAYKELKTKFDSIRNQLTTLSGKMDRATPPKSKN